MGVIVSKHHSPGTVTMVRTLTGHLCEVWLPEKASPGVCTAEFWGYEAQPVDIFAVGVCLFILCYRSPPWEKALLSDSYFRYVYKTGNAGLEELVKAWNKPCSSSTAMDLTSTMMQTDPSKRPTASECLANAYSWAWQASRCQRTSLNLPFGAEVEPQLAFTRIRGSTTPYDIILFLIKTCLPVVLVLCRELFSCLCGDPVHLCLVSVLYRR